MGLKVRDAQSLEGDLRNCARRQTGTIEEAFHRAEQWFEDVGGPARILSREALAQLCEFARSDERAEARELALGTLEYLQYHAAKSPDLARFASCLSLRRLASQSGRSLRWSGVPIRRNEVQEANQLFEKYVGGAVHDDATLLAGVQEFADAHRGKPDMFGRLAHDLEALSDVLTEPGATSEARALARAALDYFVQDADAIPDHLGIVGLLDDAFVVRRALDELRPGTAVIASFLDKAVEDWPFLIDLAFGTGPDAWPPSEFLLVNAGLLTSALRSGGADRGHALVAPEPGPLPMLLGWIGSLAEVQSFLEEGSAPDFEPGARLAHRDSGAELIFHGYVRLSPSGASQPCDRSEATHFKSEHLVRGGGSKVIRTAPVADLAVLRRSARKSETLKRGDVDLRIEQAELGPLERIFAQLRPITMPRIRGRTIVVSPIAQARAVVEELRLWDQPLSEIVPIEQARWDGSDLTTATWSQRVGGDALVTVVRTAEEALELVETSDRETRAVVAGVRPGSTDATHLARIAGLGTPVMAVVEERDADSQEAFERLGFDFWNWDDDWLGTVRWAEGQPERTDAISAYEKGLRRRASARVEVEPLEIEGSADAQAHLRELERHARKNDDEMLDDVVRAGYSLFVGLLRCLGSVEGLATQVEALGTRIDGESRWWEQEIAEEAKEAIEALARIAGALERRNPKRESCESWHRRHPGGFVVARRRSIEEAKAAGISPAIQWENANMRGSREGSGLVSAWLGAQTMTRLLVPPVSESLTLALYAPERQWYETLLSKRDRSRSKLRKLVRRRSLIPLEVLGEVDEPEPPPLEPTPDDVISRIRTASIVRTLGPAGSDPVQARVFHFIGGSWAPFALEHRVNDVTHLLAAGEGGDNKVQEVRASKLQPGDTILIHRGLEHDAIRHAADRALPEGRREAAGEWRRAVQRFLEGHQVSELHDRLAKSGCRRDPQTIRGWERDEYIIGPKDEVETLRAILSATRDAGLDQRMQDCLSAIREVRHAHFQAAFALAERVLSSAKAALGTEGSEGASDLGEELALLTIDAIETETISVARHAVNRIRDDS